MDELTDTLQKKIILAIMGANIQVDDWYHSIIEQIWQPYARGYLDAKIDSLNNQDTDLHDEAFREDLLSFCQNDIWDSNSL